jgi:catechol 2,3-dioxygenase-like lactoylglutathione lyase family enzyme
MKKLFLVLGLLATIALTPSAWKLPAARPAEPPLRPPILGVARIALKTSNLEKAREFYGHVLGLPERLTLDKSSSRPLLATFKVNNHQYIEILPGLENPGADRLARVAFETSDARRMRDYLANRGLVVPREPDRMPEGNLSVTLHDYDGHAISFFQYLPASLDKRRLQEPSPDHRISTRIIHVGITVRDQARADHLYRNILGFWEMWHGGMNDDRTDWIDMVVPDGTDWLEYMLNVRNPSARTLGVMHHLALGVESVAKGEKQIEQRGYKPEQPAIGRDGKWQLNLYDPDLTRVELMEFKPVRTPCCSPMRSSRRNSL